MKAMRNRQAARAPRRQAGPEEISIGSSGTDQMPITAAATCQVIIAAPGAKAGPITRVSNGRPANRVTIRSSVPTPPPSRPTCRARRRIAPFSFVGVQPGQLRIERGDQEPGGLGDRIGDLPADSPQRRVRRSQEGADHQGHQMGEGHAQGGVEVGRPGEPPGARHALGQGATPAEAGQEIAPAHLATVTTTR